MLGAIWEFIQMVVGLGVIIFIWGIWASAKESQERKEAGYYSKDHWKSLHPAERRRIHGLRHKYKGRK